MLTSDCYITDCWEQLKAGDQGALSVIYQHHYNGLINYGYKICGDKDAANDCFIKVLLKLWDTRSTLPQVTNLRSYLMTCLRHEIIHELKLADDQQQKLKKFYSLHNPVEHPYEDIIIRLQTDLVLKKKLTKALQHLSAREKELLQLKFYEDLDYDEIALRCNITKRTAYNIIHAALKRLKVELCTSHLTVAELYPALVLGLMFLAV
ncbi:RNA polymerase sigma factor [Foetidibacter luteolus]|uniref:RNA polymerase sigma factor n=1 Tax=Foetidibacter luteolus TaxID=2608880 RepID=UPI00129A6FE6|nr:sigma-70 family RNA polymerase sigma factor [Foetidibacter luteolus]